MLFRHVEALRAAGIDDTFLEALQTAVPAKPNVEAAAQENTGRLTVLPGLCCAAVGGERQKAKVFTAAWTLLYTALHLLDNVEDGDVTDEPWMRWGPGPAINIATGLIASAGGTLQALERGGREPCRGAGGARRLLPGAAPDDCGAARRPEPA